MAAQAHTIQSVDAEVVLEAACRVLDRIAQTRRRARPAAIESLRAEANRNCSGNVVPLRGASGHRSRDAGSRALYGRTILALLDRIEE